MSLKHGRVLLKLSGEGLMGDQEFGLDSATVERIGEEIRRPMARNISALIKSALVYEPDKK